MDASSREIKQVTSDHLSPSSPVLVQVDKKISRQAINKEGLMGDQITHCMACAESNRSEAEHDCHINKALRMLELVKHNVARLEDCQILDICLSCFGPKRHDRSMDAIKLKWLIFNKYHKLTDDRNFLESFRNWGKNVI